MDVTMILRTQLSKMLLMCGAGLSVQLLASGFEIKQLQKIIQVSVAQANDRERWEDEPLQAGVTYAAASSRACEAARRRALEVAPELLALADWPLDDSTPVECLTTRQASVESLGADALFVLIEIPEAMPVIPVMASEYGAVMTSTSGLPIQGDQFPLGQALAALNTGSLDEIRGGFELDGTGLKFSFGIERAVYINGELIASTTLNLKDLQQTAGGGISPVTLAPGTAGALGIIQNGVGNNIAATITSNMAGTVIQNSLNDQRIQNVTTINATVNSMQAVRAMSVQSAIQSGIVSSLRR